MMDVSVDDVISRIDRDELVRFTLEICTIDSPVGHEKSRRGAAGRLVRTGRLQPCLQACFDDRESPSGRMRLCAHRADDLRLTFCKLYRFSICITRQEVKRRSTKLRPQLVTSAQPSANRMPRYT
jgi:hypothetical protein